MARFPAYGEIVLFLTKIRARPYTQMLNPWHWVPYPKPSTHGDDVLQMWALREEVKELLPADLYPMMDEIIDK